VAATKTAEAAAAAASERGADQDLELSAVQIERDQLRELLTGSEERLAEASTERKVLQEQSGTYQNQIAQLQHQMSTTAAAVDAERRGWESAGAESRGAAVALDSISAANIKMMEQQIDEGTREYKRLQEHCDAVEGQLRDSARARDEEHSHTQSLQSQTAHITAKYEEILVAMQSDLRAATEEGDRVKSKLKRLEEEATQNRHPATSGSQKGVELADARKRINAVDANNAELRKNLAYTQDKLAATSSAVETERAGREIAEAWAASAAKQYTTALNDAVAAERQSVAAQYEESAVALKQRVAELEATGARLHTSGTMTVRDVGHTNDADIDHLQARLVAVEHALEAERMSVQIERKSRNQSDAGFRAAAKSVETLSTKLEMIMAESQSALNAANSRAEELEAALRAKTVHIGQVETELRDALGSNAHTVGANAIHGPTNTHDVDDLQQALVTAHATARNLTEENDLLKREACTLANQVCCFLCLI
jgi:chromosome segregation ATPase